MLLTQFMSVSLHRHIRQAYRFDAFSGGFVEILAAQQTFEPGMDWYEGTADAVRKNLRYLDQPRSSMCSFCRATSYTAWTIATCCGRTPTRVRT